MLTKLEEEIAKRACEIIISNRNESLGEGGEKVRTEFFGRDPEYLELQFDPTLKAAAEVAKKYIERAFDAGGSYMISLHSTNEEDRKQWLKENGITE